MKLSLSFSIAVLLPFAVGAICADVLDPATLGTPTILKNSFFLDFIRSRTLSDSPTFASDIPEFAGLLWLSCTLHCCLSSLSWLDTI